MYNGTGIYKNGGMDETQVRELMLNTIGGRTYKTTKIGNQIWLAENLDFKFYGMEVLSSGRWTGNPYAVYYNYDEATYGVNGNKYGLLYNWYAVELLNKYKDQLIPGWHVPSAAEWDTLATAVGGKSVAGTKLKSKTGWLSGAGTDDFGFTAFPAGQCVAGDSFSNLGLYTWFWLFDKSLEYEENRYISPGPGLLSESASKEKFYSVRLVRDA